MFWPLLILGGLGVLILRVASPLGSQPSTVKHLKAGETWRVVALAKGTTAEKIHNAFDSKGLRNLTQDSAGFHFDYLHTVTADQDVTLPETTTIQSADGRTVEFIIQGASRVSAAAVVSGKVAKKMTPRKKAVRRATPAPARRMTKTYAQRPAQAQAAQAAQAPAGSGGGGGGGGFSDWPEPDDAEAEYEEGVDPETVEEEVSEDEASEESEE